MYNIYILYMKLELVSFKQDNSDISGKFKILNSPM